MWIKGLARRRLAAERVGSRRRSQDKRQSVRHRGLRIEQFEERMLLSVAPTTVNDVLINQIGALAPQAPASRAVATDNNGDFVVAWQQYDFNSAAERTPTSTALLHQRRAADRSAGGNSIDGVAVQRQRHRGTQH